MNPPPRSEWAEHFASIPEAVRLAIAPRPIPAAIS